MIEEIALDTSVLIPYLKNDAAIARRIDEVNQIVIPFFVLGEMMVGFSSGPHSEKTLREFDDFLSLTRIIECGREVADYYGKIFADLKRKGSMIPVNDIWIAACCLAHDVNLATRDAHFQKIEGLKTEIW